MAISKPAPRAYAGPADLRAMQKHVQSIWSLESRFHIGDLAWQRFEHVGREADWPTVLWEEDGDVVGWGWAHRSDGVLYFAVRPDRAALATEIIDWFEKTVPESVLSVQTLDKESHLIAALLDRGYRVASSGPFDLCVVLDLASLPPTPALMPGLTAVSMAHGKDVGLRAAGHRAAWHPSRVTAESYRAVMAAWPYRAELDWMIEDADGQVAANCCLWFDEVNAVALLEPVGVDPKFRRLGLGRAVCLHACHALRELGATRVISYPRGDDAYPVPKHLYFGMGFKPYARTQTFIKRR